MATDSKSLVRLALPRLLVLVGTTLVCLFVAEVFLRVKNSAMKNYDVEMWRYANTIKVRSDNPVLGHEHRPSTSAVLQSVVIRTNEKGMRGGPIPARAPDERRILFLGSSITLGWGVAEEDTTTARLQRLFEADGHNVTVCNAGIGNYNATRYVELFMTRLQDLEPTDIVVHSFVRDAEVLDAGGGNWLLRNSQLAVTFWTAVQRSMKGTGDKSLEEHYRKVYDPQGPGFHAMAESWQRLADYARSRGIRIYLAMVPDIHNLKDYKLKFIHNQVGTLAQKEGYKYLDLLIAFEGMDPEQVWAMPGDPHPNSVGHERMAQQLYRFLQLETVARDDRP